MSKTPHAQSATTQQLPPPGNDDTRRLALDSAIRLNIGAVDAVIIAAAKIEAYLRDGQPPAPVEPKA